MALSDSLQSPNILSFCLTPISSFYAVCLLTGDVAFRLHRAPSILMGKRNERATWRSLIRRKRESAVSYSPQVLLFFLFSFVVLSICAFAALSFSRIETYIKLYFIPSIRKSLFCRFVFFRFWSFRHSGKSPSFVVSLLSILSFCT